mgnify:CR=1 FL=1
MYHGRCTGKRKYLVFFGGFIRPILYPQANNPAELPLIVCDQNQPLRHGLSSDQQIQGTNRSTSCFQGGPYTAVNRRCTLIEVQNRERHEELEQSNSILVNPPASTNPIFQFGNCDSGNCYFFRLFRSNTLHRRWRSLVDYVDTRVCIEQVLHSIGSRFSVKP